MKQNLTLLFFGLVFWTAGTLYYQRLGARVFETTAPRFWINFILSPVLSAVVCLALLRMLQVPHSAWASAALLLALPGMFGETILLLHFARWMPNLHPTSAGRYGSFLFAAYGITLALAEAVTLRATR